MSAALILNVATSVCLVVLALALLITVVRIVRGPTLADRVLGLDLLVVIAIGLIAVIAVRTGVSLYIDIAIALCLVGFLATVAFARFIVADKTSAHEPTTRLQGARQVRTPSARARKRKKR